MAPDRHDFRSCYITITAPRHVIVDKGQNNCLLCSEGLSVKLEYISGLIRNPSALCVKDSSFPVSTIIPSAMGSLGDLDNARRLRRLGCYFLVSISFYVHSSKVIVESCSATPLY